MRYPKKQLRLNEENLKLRIELEKHIQEVIRGLHEEVDIIETQLERTTLAMQYEKEGNGQKALLLYQKNVDDEALDPQSYIRLAELYKKANNSAQEIKTLEKALLVFEDLSFKRTSIFSQRLSELHEAISQTMVIAESLNDSDNISYIENLDYFKKRLNEAYRKNEK